MNAFETPCVHCGIPHMTSSEYCCHSCQLEASGVLVSQEITIPPDQVLIDHITGQVIPDRRTHEGPGDAVIYVRLGVAIQMANAAHEAGKMNTNQEPE